MHASRTRACVCVRGRDEKSRNGGRIIIDVGDGAISLCNRGHASDVTFVYIYNSREIYRRIPRVSNGTSRRWHSRRTDTDTHTHRHGHAPLDFPYLAAVIKHLQRDSPRKNERLSRWRRGNAMESRAECAIRNAEADVDGAPCDHKTTHSETTTRHVPGKSARDFDYH